MTSLEEVILTTRVIYTDSLSLSTCPSEAGSYASGRGERCASSANSSPTHSGRESRLVMDDKDKGIYNSLGSSSTTGGKPTYYELGLNKGIQKRGIMCKTAPNPSWYSHWNRRLFVLKGNFLYYFIPNRPVGLMSTPAHGAVYLKNAVIEKISMPFARRVLKITPPVPRRRGWEEDESSIFYIKFKTESGRDEWYEELQQVAFCHQFPAEKSPLISKSMKFKFEGAKVDLSKKH